jgi:16S rRNA (cytosine1402-N4)-methyltransferase
VAERDRAPIGTTRALAGVVERVIRAKPGDIHPATRTFQALRMFVNEELEELASALTGAERLLGPGGRLAVITFHSLEDRLVKRFLVARSRTAPVSRHQPLTAAPSPSFQLLTPKPLTAEEAELRENPRARSAKLRGAQRTAAPALDRAVEALPAVPSLAAIMRGH